MEFFTTSFAGKVFVLLFLNPMTETMSVQYSLRTDSPDLSQSTTEYLGHASCASDSAAEGRFVCKTTLEGQNVSIRYISSLYSGDVDVSIEKI